MLIYLYVKDELSYDRFNSKADRIYRLTEKINLEGEGGEVSSSNPFPVMKAMLTDYPQYIEEGVRLFNFQQPTLTLQYEDQKFNEKRFSLLIQLSLRYLIFHFHKEIRILHLQIQIQ